MKIDDYDRKDEQLAGIGELIKEMNDRIMGIGEGLRAISECLRDMNENVVLVSLEDKE